MSRSIDHVCAQDNPCSANKAKLRTTKNDNFAVWSDLSLSSKENLKIIRYSKLFYLLH